MFITYVLQSQKDGALYIGFTSDLQKRLREHAAGDVAATKFRRPFDLVYCEICRAKEDAVKREKYFKSGFGRRFLKHRLANDHKLIQARDGGRTKKDAK